jgi:synaptobrevin family protein YKT6
MTIYSLKVFKSTENKNILLASCEDISSFPFYARMTNSASEFLLFTSRTFADNSVPGNFDKCVEGNYIIYIHHKFEGLIPVLITDKSYPQRVAFEVLSKAVRLFKSEDHNWDWEMRETETEGGYNVVNEKFEKLIKDYADPNTEDNLLKVTNKLSETKVIMTESVNKLIERGDHIDELVNKSKDLSKTTKNFYKKSKQMNSWCGGCNIM